MQSTQINDEEYYLFEFPASFDPNSLKKIKHDNFNINDSEINEYLLANLNDNSLSNKGKVVLFENNGKLKFKEVKKFVKVMKKAENPVPSYKNVLCKRKNQSKLNN